MRSFYTLEIQKAHPRYQDASKLLQECQNDHCKPRAIRYIQLPLAQSMVALPLHERHSFPLTWR